MVKDLPSIYMTTQENQTYMQKSYLQYNIIKHITKKPKKGWLSILSVKERKQLSQVWDGYTFQPQEMCINAKG